MTSKNEKKETREPNYVIRQV